MGLMQRLNAVPQPDILDLQPGWLWVGLGAIFQPILRGHSGVLVIDPNHQTKGRVRDTACPKEFNLIDVENDLSRIPFQPVSMPVCHMGLDL